MGLTPDVSFRALRIANINRLPLFKNKNGEIAHSQPDASDWSLDDWLVALNGEVGELFNLIKKVSRRDYTLAALRQELSDEIADVVIYLDILSFRVGAPTVNPSLSRFSEVDTTMLWHNCTSRSKTCTTLVKLLGDLALIIQHTNRGTKLTEEQAEALTSICACTFDVLVRLAEFLNVDLSWAVIDKFNAVSHRVGADVTLSLEGNIALVDGAQRA